MATRFLSDAERASLETWPAEISHTDLVAHFTLDVADVRWLARQRSPANRLGLSVQLTGLRYLGFLPGELAALPPLVLDRLAAELGVGPQVFADYLDLGERARREHAAAVIERAGWQTCGRGEWKRLGDWLVERALEHDTPSVLFRAALDHLRDAQIVRPGVDRLMRAVAAARATAWTELYLRVGPLLTSTRRGQLDRLLATDPDLRVAPLVWLNTGATQASPETIKTEVDKLDYLRGIGADRLDLSVVPPERVRELAGWARRSTPRALRRLDSDRRYPVLLAAAATTCTEIVDEVVRLFDQALAATDGRARRQVAEQRAALVKGDYERLRLLDEILDIVLDDGLDDAAVGANLRHLGRDRLAGAARPPAERPPADGGHLALLEARHSYLRQFAPHVLAAIEFSASVEPSEVLNAVTLLRRLNAEGRRTVPDDAPTGFVPARWQPYLDAAHAAGKTAEYRHYWELAVLFALQGALRSGEIWVEGSRRYANPASYLIPAERWQDIRADTLVRTRAPTRFADRLAALEAELEGHLDELETQLGEPDADIRLDDDSVLHLSPLGAEELDPRLQAEHDRLLSRLPHVQTAELLIEVDTVTNWTDHLTHAGGGTPRHPDIEHRRLLYAAVLAQASNFGITRMAELSGLSADALTWTTEWYLREQTLQPATTAIVNAHYRHPLTRAWGGGTLSSSDGLRFPMRGKSLTARALSRYYLDRGLTSYTWLSDQFSTYGTQVIVSTDRDATYVLDGILGNTTELPIAEHTVDTHGQTFIVTALFDLVGLRLSPRIADLTAKPLWRTRPLGYYLDRWPRAGPLLANPARVEMIDQHWDDLCRIGGSLKLGHVSASLLTGKLQAGARQHPLAKALLEHGKLLRTVHAVRWFAEEVFRRRIGRQLNRGESVNDLRRHLWVAQRGNVHHRHHDDQTMQAHCHTLLTNACILWTTLYLQDAVDAHRADGIDVPADLIAHISPACFEHISPWGTYNFDVAGIRRRTRRRPLRPLERH